MYRVADPTAGVMVNRTAEGPSFRRTLGGLHRYRHLLRNLVMKDLKLKYRGSVIGFMWSLANPLLMTIIYTFAFRHVMRRRRRRLRLLSAARIARLDVLLRVPRRCRRARSPTTAAW